LLLVLLQGLFGVGIASSNNPQVVVGEAYIKAYQNLVPIPLYRGHTIYHRIDHKFHTIKVCSAAAPAAGGLLLCASALGGLPLPASAWGGLPFCPVRSLLWRTWRPALQKSCTWRPALQQLCA
jgi:hypothetical protein